MYKVYSIGEVLIDFLDQGNQQFKAHAGGAPANVAVVVKKLGGMASIIGSAGKDYFGDFLKETLIKLEVCTEHLKQINHPTMLAFVVLDEKGDRSFSFYRNDTADQYLSTDNILFQNDIIHYCSVSLNNENNILAHKKAINQIKNNQGIVSFDPNLRLNLWEDKNKLKRIVKDFLSISDIVKVSEEELLYLSDCKTEDAALKYFEQYELKVLFVTRGANGSTAYTKNGVFNHPGFKVNTVDTTGAGDAFIGAILFKIQQLGLKLDMLDKIKWQDILEFASLVSATSSEKFGAIESYQFDDLLK